MQRAKDDKDTMPVRTSGAVVHHRPADRLVCRRRSCPLPSRPNARPGTKPNIYCSHEELDTIVLNQPDIYRKESTDTHAVLNPLCTTSTSQQPQLRRLEIILSNDSSRSLSRECAYTPLNICCSKPQLKKTEGSTFQYWYGGFPVSSQGFVGGIFNPLYQYFS
jgi:hypothetical protein